MGEIRYSAQQGNGFVAPSGEERKVPKWNICCIRLSDLATACRAWGRWLSWVCHSTCRIVMQIKDKSGSHNVSTFMTEPTWAWELVRYLAQSLQWSWEWGRLQKKKNRGKMMRMHGSQTGNLLQVQNRHGSGLQHMEPSWVTLQTSLHIYCHIPQCGQFLEVRAQSDGGNDHDTYGRSNSTRLGHIFKGLRTHWLQTCTLCKLGFMTRSCICT